ncbi:MAG: four helix bundle protein [Burkholderiales bacterium]
MLVWQKSMDLVEAIYKLTRTFPQEERFGLTSQLQKAAVSIPSNIAEGHGRKFTKVYLNASSIASGSLMEVETHLQIGARLRYLSSQQLDEMLTKTQEIGRMLNGLIKSLNPESLILNPDDRD